MDRGIIKNFKMFYRKLLLRIVISKSDLGQSASIIAKAVPILDAIRWVDEAWNNVQDTTIKNCFRKAGFNLTETGLETETTEDESVTQFPVEIDFVSYNFEEFVNCDNDVAFTQIYDAKELRKAVLADAMFCDFSEAFG